MYVSIFKTESKRHNVRKMIFLQVLDLSVCSSRMEALNLKPYHEFKDELTNGCQSNAFLDACHAWKTQNHILKCKTIFNRKFS